MKINKYIKTVLSGGIIAIGLLSMAGCSTNKTEPRQVPYMVFDKGVVSDSQKVLIDASYQTFIDGEVDANDKGQKLLFKTTVFFKEKNYVLFLSKEISPGSSIEFILRDDKLTNIQLKGL